MKKTRIALIGIGGFGNQYVRALLTNPYDMEYKIVGACDPRPEGCENLAALQALRVPLFSDPQSLFAACKADLACIATPIYLHVEHALLAFHNGCDVLLEKPVAATAEETLRIIRARDAAQKHLAIGFQWCYDQAMQNLKKDILANRFGKLLKMQAMVLWPRDWAYYARGGGWAGKRLSANGLPLYDSVASNATAHYIMNMLWLAGSSYASAEPVRNAQVWTGRANDIEMFDSIAFAGVVGDTEILYCASHAILPEDTVNPTFLYTFANGVCRYAQDESDALCVQMHHGETISYGNTNPNGTNTEKLWQVLKAVQTGDWSSLPCPAEAALAHAITMDTLNITPVQDLRSLRERDSERNAWVIPGMGTWLKNIYHTGRILNTY